MKRSSLQRKTPLRRKPAKPNPRKPKKRRSGGIKRTAADARFSTEIRERDNWTCQRCGKSYVPPTRALHAAHCFTRGTKATRHDPENARAACYGCHSWLDGHPDEKYAWFTAWLGAEAFDALRRRANLVAADA